jgi:hypothetical protein
MGKDFVSAHGGKRLAGSEGIFAFSDRKGHTKYNPPPDSKYCNLDILLQLILGGGQPQNQSQPVFSMEYAVFILLFSVVKARSGF